MHKHYAEMGKSMRLYNFLISFLRRLILACLLFLAIFFWHQFDISFFGKNANWLNTEIANQEVFEQLRQSIQSVFDSK